MNAAKLWVCFKYSMFLNSNKDLKWNIFQWFSTLFSAVIQLLDHKGIQQFDVIKKYISRKYSIII